MKRWFYLIVALQTLFIVGEAGRYAAQAKSGQEVILKVHPVDPRSLFMGNYMALEPDIAKLDLNTLDFNTAGSVIETGDEVFVAVRPESTWAVPVAASVEKLYASRPGAILLRGTITSVEGPATRPSAISVDYGLNRFYIPDARQAEITRHLAQTRKGGLPPAITVTVSVPPSGRSILRAMHINGWPVPS
jgi:uncharacterized membrane-anchored protein